jgi:NAD(P)H dehydrogenase (quinone)
VVTGEGHENTVYELGGEAFTMVELAAEISRQSGREVRYTDLPEREYAEVLAGAGVPGPMVAVLADSDRGAAKGGLYVEGDDLEKLIGRPVTKLADAIRAALA